MAERDDYDSPWKEALEQYLPEFMAFFFPAAHADIDWSRGYRLLDQELRQVVRDAELGKRIVDKLVEVTRLDGGTDWVYIHIEVQGERDGAFPRRMFTYNYRIFDRYARPVASFAVLADESPGWRPQGFGYELFGCRMALDFPVVKLLDWQAQVEQLLADDNAFALVTAAHLLTQRTRGDEEARFAAKWRLIRLLYQRGWDRERVVALLSVIDWLMQLPPALAERLRYNIEQLEEETQMRYVTSFERMAEQRGEQRGEAKVLLRQLERKYGAETVAAYRGRVEQADAETLLAWSEHILTANSIEEVFH